MLQPLRTASAADSIWKNISEATFHKHVAQLTGKTLQPVEARLSFEAFLGPKAVVQRQQEGQAERSLTIELEQSLANDFAFLAASDEGAVNVAGCCIEENAVEGQKCLTVRLAANEGVPEEVRDQLQAICELLRAEASRGKVSACRSKQIVLI